LSRRRDLRPYFTDDALVHPPNVVDSELDAFGPEVAGKYSIPRIVEATNLLCKHNRTSNAREDGQPRPNNHMSFRPDLVLSPRGALTRFHVDSGFATWFDMREGSKDWAMCSLEDGLALGLHEHRSVTLEQFLARPSATLCRLQAGHSLFFPAAYFHFVVTRAPSFGFSNNVINLGGFGVAMGLYHMENNRWAVDNERRDMLISTHLEALSIHAEECNVTTKLASRPDAKGCSDDSCMEQVFCQEGVSPRTSALYRNSVQLLWASA